jgi:hypothetical protein
VLIWTAAVLAAAVIAFGGFAIWFLRDDAPDEVSIGDAAAQVADGAADASAAETSPAENSSRPRAPRSPR